MLIMKKVAIFTTFYEAESGYSLIAVTEGQLKSLIAHNYDPIVLVQENFSFPKNNQLWQKEHVDIRPVVPFLHLNRGVVDDFETRASSIQNVLRTNLKDVDVCITHDIVLQDYYKEHNVAMRNYAKERPDLLWLHWIHSCPTPAKDVKEYPEDCRYSPPPGYIIYPNYTDSALVQQTYKLEGLEWKVKTHRHCLDILDSYTYDNLTKDLAKASGMLDAELSIVYPIRLDRGKQPEKIIRLVAGLNRLSFKTNLLIVDWQSSGSEFQKYIDELIILTDELGIKDRVNFTSRLDDRCSQGIPRKNVLELLDLSNVYIHPSRIETYSLVVHEAILRNNLVVLNHDLPVMSELFGDTAIYMDFGSDRHSRTYHPTEQDFWNDEAKRLISEYKQNRSLVARTKAKLNWSPSALWKDFEPLLYLTPIGE